MLVTADHRNRRNKLLLFVLPACLILPLVAHARQFKIELVALRPLYQALSLFEQGQVAEGDRTLRDFVAAQLSRISPKTGAPVLTTRIDPSQAKVLRATADKLVADQRYASEGHSVLGVIALLEGKSAAALTEFNEAARLKPASETPKVFQAVTYRLSGKLDAALKVYAQLRKANPKLNVGYIGQAETYYAMGNRAAALQVLNEWKKSAPGDPEPSNVLGLTYVAEKRFPDAIKEFDASLAISPRYAPALTNKGDALILQGNRPAGIESLRRALEADDHFIPAYLRLGTVYAEAGQFNESLAVFEKAVSLKLPVAPFYNNAAWLKLKLNQNVDAALQLAERAVALDPQYGDARGTLGWACLQKGDVDRAIRELKRAKDLSGDRPENTLHLGTAYYRKNMRVEALVELRKLPKLFPQSPEAAVAQKLIAELGGA
jgi:tetratricopeptide (TPR) repeat protein